MIIVIIQINHKTENKPRVTNILFTFIHKEWNEDKS